MPLSEEQRAEFQAATRGAASAFVEDIDHIRKVVTAAPPDKGDLRRLSNVLRRLLVNREIQEIASPRIGRFNVDAPDNKPSINYAKTLDLIYFEVGGGTIRFAPGEYMVFVHVCVAPPQNVQLPPHDSDRRIPLRVDNFLAQPLIFIDGNWITRNQVIQYVANIGSGVHSGTPRTDVEKRLELVRRSMKYSISPASLPNGGPGNPVMEFRLDGLRPGPFDFSFTNSAIDPLLVEMIATAEFFERSADTLRLEKAIKEELGI